MSPDAPIQPTAITRPTFNSIDVGDRFRLLAAQWIAERPRGADVHWMTDTPAYRAIIDLGQPAVPLLLAELRRSVDHWFSALHAITGADPVPPEARGKMKLMAAAWLRWGAARGLIGEVD
jgi:hypothetical protein